MARQRQTKAQLAMRSRIYTYVTEFCARNGYSPTYREIAQAVGIKSAATVSRYVHWLMDEGLLSHDSAKPRTLSTVAPGDAEPVETIQQRICLELADGGKVYMDCSLTKPRTAPVRLYFDGVLDAQSIRGRVGRIVRCNPTGD